MNVITAKALLHWITHSPREDKLLQVILKVSRSFNEPAIEYTCRLVLAKTL